jgi:uncharacterized membrane protein YfcA
MLGLGVAFIATPVLGLFGFELKNVIMPWSLWLNGLNSHLQRSSIRSRQNGRLAYCYSPLVITTTVAPVGVWLLQFVPTNIVWYIYVIVLIFLAYRMAFPPKMDDAKEMQISDKKRVLGGVLSAFIGIFAGFLGVGLVF